MSETKPASLSSEFKLPAEAITGKYGERLPKFVTQWLRKMYSFDRQRNLPLVDKLRCVVDAEGRLLPESTIRIEQVGYHSEAVAQLRPALIVSRHEKTIRPRTICNGNDSGGLPANLDGSSVYQRDVVTGVSVACEADNYSQCDELQHDVATLLDQIGIYLAGQAGLVTQFNVTGISAPRLVKKDSAEVYAGSVDTVIQYVFTLRLTEVAPIIRAIYQSASQF